MDMLICNSFDFENKGHRFSLEYGRHNNATSFNVNVTDSKTGMQEAELNYSVSDSNIKQNYDKDSFNTIYSACEKVKEDLKNKDFDILKSYKL